MGKNSSYYHKQPLKSQLEISGIYTVHYFKYGKKFKYKEESHNFYELVYIDSGSATIKSNQQSFTLNQGECFIHKPNDLHTISTMEEFANSVILSFECNNKILLNLSGKIIHLNVLHKQLLNQIISEAKQGYCDRLDDLSLNKMNKSENPPLGCDQIIKNCIELLLISLLRQECETSKTNTSNVQGLNSLLVRQILDILNYNIDVSDHVSLEQISYKIGYSKSYLKSKFKTETGKSIIQYFLEMKVEKAKKLLSYGNITINEISESLKFNSVQYFCRVFKQRTGMTPTEYANSIKADNLL